MSLVSHLWLNYEYFVPTKTFKVAAKIFVKISRSVSIKTNLKVGAVFVISVFFIKSSAVVISVFFYQKLCHFQIRMLSDFFSLFKIDPDSARLSYELKILLSNQHFLHRSLLFQLHLEAGLTLLHYYDYKGADSEFEAAREMCGVEFGFTGTPVNTSLSSCA